jgi:UDP-GlcNAc3NAcA epimerase
MKKILTVIGARPQFIKAAPLSKAISESEGLEEILLHTGQHFDEKMSDIFFTEMKIPQPKYRFNINSLNHGAMTGLMLKEIEAVVLSEQPDLLLVFGDTNSTLAGALAAKKLHVKVAHVEAGLRSFNMQMPEEINRILTDRLSDYLYCPSEQAVMNLDREGYSVFEAQVIRTGDIMLDAMTMFSETADLHSRILEKIGKIPYVLATLHRAENTDNIERLRAIVSALEVINRDIRVILPLHPRTRKIMQDSGMGSSLELLEPVGYFDMIALLKNCAWVMTDSGGLQKEAYFMKKYCVTLRDQTEWVELTECGANVLAGADTDRILANTAQISEKQFTIQDGLYGNGNTALQIVSHLQSSL